MLCSRIWRDLSRGKFWCRWAVHETWQKHFLSISYIQDSYVFPSKFLHQEPSGSARIREDRKIKQKKSNKISFCLPTSRPFQRDIQEMKASIFFKYSFSHLSIFRWTHFTVPFFSPRKLWLNFGPKKLRGIKICSKRPAKLCLTLRWTT